MNRRSFLSKLLALPVVGAIAAKVIAVEPAVVLYDPALPPSPQNWVPTPDLDEDVIYFVDTVMLPKPVEGQDGWYINGRLCTEKAVRIPTITRQGSEDIVMQRKLYADGRWGLGSPEAQEYLSKCDGQV